VQLTSDVVHTPTHPHTSQLVADSSNHKSLVIRYDEPRGRGQYASSRAASQTSRLAPHEPEPGDETSAAQEANLHTVNGTDADHTNVDENLPGMHAAGVQPGEEGSSQLTAAAECNAGPADGAPDLVDNVHVHEKGKLVISTDALESHRDAQAAMFLIKAAQNGDDDRSQHDVDVGSFAGPDVLQNVGALLAHVYIPMLAQHTSADQSVPASSSVASDSHKTAESDIVASLQRFLGSIKTSSAHLTGNVQLKIPDVDVESWDGKDDDLTTTLESAMHDWTIVLQNVKQAEATKQPAGDGPLDEITFWNERNSVLSSMYEQIQLPKAQAIIRSVLCHALQPLCMLQQLCLLRAAFHVNGPDPRPARLRLQVCGCTCCRPGVGGNFSDARG
jgi:dynein heavy chain, axonemal